jgi:hypothetical protein
MGNSLLDFVMALVRDPEVAAQYAADPAGALAAAGLPEVTMADVSSLIPMVTDSLAMSSPGFSGAVPPAADAANVWASGAATAAFDAFGITPPAPAAPEIASMSSIDDADPTAHTDAAPGGEQHPGDLGEMPAFPDPAYSAPAPEAMPWTDHTDLGGVVDPHPGEPPAFDLF